MMQVSNGELDGCHIDKVGCIILGNLGSIQYVRGNQKWV